LEAETLFLETTFTDEIKNYILRESWDLREVAGRYLQINLII